MVSALSNVLLRDQTNDPPTDTGVPSLVVYEFSFKAADRGLGVEVSEVEVDPTEGFEIDQFSDVADEVFRTSIRLYNALHAESES